MVCDHRDDDQVRRLFERIGGEAGGLDILVSNQIGWSDSDNPDAFRRRRLWQRPMSWWDDNFDAGVRGHVLNCRCAVPLMLERDHGTLLLTSERAAATPETAWDAVLDPRATVVERLAAIVAEQLRPWHVTAMLLYPGWTRTEDQIASVRAGIVPMVDSMEDYLVRTASAHFAGRAAASVAADPASLALSGTLVTAQELARRYAFTDVDGRVPDTV